VCTPLGIIFENSALLPFLMKHKVDPVTGTKMSTRDVITLHMDKDEEGRWQCPVLTKPFSNQTKIVAIRQPGTNEANVYSFEAYQELNVKTKNYEDLISGVKFSKKTDVIVLNDPSDDEHIRLRDINNFHHILTQRNNDTMKPADSVKYSVTATRVMEQLQKNQKMAASDKTSNTETKSKIFSTAVTGTQLTSGKVSGSLTSTFMNIADTDDAKEATQEEILSAQFQLMKKRKKKGYVTLHTSLGDIGLELHCDVAPRTCTNFLGLAQAGAYDNTKFHRLIPNFMIQGGKSETGEDSSLWGGSFPDEFDDRLTHTGEGILAMANAGPGTNKQQFYLTFHSCNHLDRKHSVFGRVVQGMEVLKAMEQVPVLKKDRPIDEIKINSVEVLVNPAKQAEEAEQIRIQERSEAMKREEDARKASALGRNSSSMPPAKRKTMTNVAESTASGPSPVGKYLAVTSAAKKPKKAAAKDDDIDRKSAPASRLPPPPKTTKFNDFSGW
jgi:peptidyl-prolyl cis-trans isomerase-like protein 2